MNSEFIICARPRVGTHMFKSGLVKHPEIHCADELLNIYMFLPQQQLCYTLLDIRKRIQENNPGLTTGWILHDDQYFYAKRRTIIVKQKDWDDIPVETKIIRLNRRNELKRLVSECRAKRSEVWTKFRRDIYVNADLPFYLDFDVLMKHYEFHKKASLAQEKYLQRFQNVLHVWYEDLQTQWDKEIERAFSFLGQEIMVVEPSTVKMGIPLQYMVSNYDELEDKCHGTDLEQYF